MFSGKPLLFALGLDPGAIDQKVQRTIAEATGMVDSQTLLAAA
jgi:hypothetical protein